MHRSTSRGLVAAAAGPRDVPAPARSSGSRGWWLVAVAGLLGAVLLAGSYASAQERSADLAADLGAGPVLAVPEVTRTAAPPVALIVPILGIDTRLAGLHVGKDGLQVDEDPQTAGWYVDGPAPGDLGPAVLAGHLNSRAGPGIFAGLDRVRPGERIDIRRDDGTTAQFAVTEVQTYAKREFPTARVYRGDGTASLRIITCGGEFDARSGRYRSNTIVYADLVGSGPTPG